MRRRLFCANWKMHHGPRAAREFLVAFLQAYPRADDRRVWFFPPAVSLTTVIELLQGREDLGAGAQNVHWEAKGAYTGEISVPMLQEIGAVGAIVGHSERRHIFGEKDEEAGRKARALLQAGLRAVFCVGEKLEERKAGRTWEVVERQLSVLADLDLGLLGRLVIAYEPVWAIGTGHNATPADAAQVHRAIKAWFRQRGASPEQVTVLYGGSVNPQNARELLAEPEIDGLLVGGASLQPDSWLKIVTA